MLIELLSCRTINYDPFLWNQIVVRQIIFRPKAFDLEEVRIDLLILKNSGESAGYPLAVRDMSIGTIFASIKLT
ncbi:hypothetical protein [Thermincola ferriacetica]|uniref:hypothetical protein n=1 Tax=Thermincola ferriacetica TaxID=281456 RepID=UPI00068ACA7F|nr:hypothetical protein [Thermincola ferriacetica]